MNQIPDNVRQALIELLPQSVINEVACFIFYDKHPRDQRPTDIAICTQKGEVKEFYQREVVGSILIENLKDIIEIIALRNNKCDLYYIVVAKNEIIILSKKDTLSLKQRIFNVDRYAIEEPCCKGLKIFCNDDAVPISFDDNMNKLADSDLLMPHAHTEDSLPLINQLMRKLVEAKYTTKYNENTLNDFIKLRQLTAFQMYTNVQLNENNAVFRIDRNEISSALQIEMQAPFIRICNNKIVILTHILNKNDDPINDLYVLLHGTMRVAVEYTSRVFVQTPNPPFWCESIVKINSNEKCTLTTVVDLEEVKHNVDSRIDFDVVISLRIKEKNFLLPLETVALSALDIIRENNNVLSNYEDDSNNLLLSIIATSQRVDLCLRHIKNSEEDTQLTLSNIFCDYIKMESLDIDNVVVFKDSPHHMLYGILVIFDNDNSDVEFEHVDNIQVYTRSSAQILSLIHYIYDLVPYKIIITTPEYELTAKITELARYNEKKVYKLNYADCAMSVQSQVEIMQDHIKKCILKTNAEVSDLDGKEIDLLAEGVPKYSEFKNKLAEESLNGIDSLKFEKCILADVEPDVMIIDD